MTVGLLFGIVAVVSITAVYFIWGRKAAEASERA